MLRWLVLLSEMAGSELGTDWRLEDRVVLDTSNFRVDDDIVAAPVTFITFSKLQCIEYIIV